MLSRKFQRLLLTMTHKELIQVLLTSCTMTEEEETAIRDQIRKNEADIAYSNRTLYGHTGSHNDTGNLPPVNTQD